MKLIPWWTNDELDKLFHVLKWSKMINFSSWSKDIHQCVCCHKVFELVETCKVKRNWERERERWQLGDKKEGLKNKKQKEKDWTNTTNHYCLCWSFVPFNSNYVSILLLEKTTKLNLIEKALNNQLM
jgi:hypothetical protein